MLVSIIIPYYDDEKNIKISVKSALNQTYNNTEIIIIDNENSNRSNNILKNLSKKSKKLKLLESNKVELCWFRKKYWYQKFKR